VHALWTLAGLNALDPDLARRALRDAAPLVRSAGIRLLEDGLSQPAARADLQAVLALLRDPDSFVRLQAALSTGGIDDPAVDAARLAAVLADPAHVHLRSAFLSGIRNRERTMLLQLLDSGDTRAVALALASDLAGGVFVAREPSPIAEVIAAAAQTAPELGASVLAGFAAVANASPRAVVLPNEPSGWAQLAALPAATKPVSDLATLLRWSGKPGLDAVAQVAPLTPAQEVRFANGRELFAGICAACHQADGRGLDGVAPPLLDSQWVLGPPERTIRIVLQGVRGPIVVLNHWYTGDMPGLGGLDDHQISSVLTYLRREWGHTASAVEPEDVAAVRAATAGRNDAWTQDELNLIKPTAPATPAAKPAPVASR
jgi:mono/diheme cytochrome c family protein